MADPAPRVCDYCGAYATHVCRCPACNQAACFSSVGDLERGHACSSHVGPEHAPSRLKAARKMCRSLPTKYRLDRSLAPFEDADLFVLLFAAWLGELSVEQRERMRAPLAQRVNGALEKLLREGAP